MAFIICIIYQTINPLQLVHKLFDERSIFSSILISYNHFTLRMHNEGRKKVGQAVKRNKGGNSYARFLQTKVF